MSFVNPALLYGLGCVTIPVMLHLLMRAKPKKMLFPALRLIQQRRLQNVRRMRIKHLWLLFLRMAVLAAIVLAVTRPSLPAADYRLTLSETLTLAGIVSLALGAGFGAEHWWKKQRLAPQVIASRRTMWQGGLGLSSLILAALLVGWPYQQRIALALAAPAPMAAEDTPVSAVMLFDTSLSMAYTREGESRLEVAKRIALQHVSRLPGRSQVAIGETTTSDPIVFQADLSAANGRLESLKTGIVSSPINDRLREATSLQEDDRGRTLARQENVPVDDRSDGLIREIYIFTDLAQSAWSKSPGTFMQEELKRLAWLGIYLVDVGVEQPRNIALTNLRLSDESVSVGKPATVFASVPSIGFANQEQVVELFMESASGEFVKKDQRSIKLSESAAVDVQFNLTGLNRRTERGQLRLVSTDPLIEDNKLDFAVRVDSAIRVLISSPSDDVGDDLLAALNALRYSATFVPQNKLNTTVLSQYDVVCLVNANGSSPEVWKLLTDYVTAGGGLLIALGAEFDPNIGINSVGYNGEPARSILPAELVGPLNFRPAKSLDLKDTSHPLLKVFDAPGVAAELMTVDVRRYWKVKPHAEAKVIASYSDNAASPAFVERALGQGRTVLVTTSVDLKGDWNDLPRQSPAYFLMLIDQSMQYLSRRTDARVNFIAGEEALVPLNREKPMTDYLLRKPSGVQLPGKVPPATVDLRIGPLDERGVYYVVSTQQDAAFEAGFAVNVPPQESNFTRMTPSDLDQWLGENRYSVATSIDGLQKSVTTGRLGVEAFPMVLAVLLVAFCLEHIVANRFYQADQQPEPVTTS